MKKSIDYIVNWLKKHNDNAKTNGFVLGLSGGIDSAVVAGLCKLACPNTLGIILPCNSSEQDEKDAKLVAEALNLDIMTFDLSKHFNNLTKDLEASLTSEAKRMALANIKPRLRMTTLYFYANMQNRLVIGTGNRDERYVGYFTKWGDGGADLMPIAHLSKEEVWQMARDLNIPNAVIEKPPSAGLWQNQTDEQEMGFSYKILEHYLQGKDVPQDSKKRIEHLHKVSRHKVNLPPIIEVEEQK
ncbi:NAD(+) synthase [Clostridium sp. 'deep sea']|uniref:NAD(+) synthase n=1 Tax=Clostridium sp. 'deep sea' TaxID=2779445 RepID=UPI0018969986|nr:NAD(+) synthase [Clostridium sp. 'deep sea']QOR35668.1 NAD(+) synthase [Clostridium sp. 'deep sea']